MASYKAKDYYGRSDRIEIDTIKDSDNEICVALSDDVMGYVNEFITKEDAIAIIKHLQDVFELSDGK